MFRGVSKRKKYRSGKMSQKGFTLMELIITIIIVGILASISMVRYDTLVERSRKTEAFATLKAILDAQKRHALEYRQYASTVYGLDINVSQGGKYYGFYLANNTDPYAIANETIAAAGRSDGSYEIQITELGVFVDDVVTGCISSCSPPNENPDEPDPT